MKNTRCLADMLKRLPRAVIGSRICALIATQPVDCDRREELRISFKRCTTHQPTEQFA